MTDPLPVDLSRPQPAPTALCRFLLAPLTLGLFVPIAMVPILLPTS